MRYLTIFLIVFLLGCKDSKTESKPVRKEMTVAVYSSVRLEPLGMYQVKASVGGFLESMVVEEGQLIESGDVLFVISDVASRMNLQNAELSYQLAYDSYRGEANILEEMRVDLNSSLSKMRNDSLNLKRLRLKTRIGKACLSWSFPTTFSFNQVTSSCPVDFNIITW